MLNNNKFKFKYIPPLTAKAKTDPLQPTKK